MRHWIGGLVSQFHGGPALHEIVPEDIEYSAEIAQDTNLIGVCIK
jgi:hypothetical protein